MAINKWFKNNSTISKLWWHLMPGDTVKVKWPSGNIVVDHNDPRWVDMGGAVWVDLGFSSDPNDHYRHWMEEKVGRQGWDWDWVLAPDNSNEIIIKVRKKHSQHATMIGIMWT